MLMRGVRNVSGSGMRCVDPVRRSIQISLLVADCVLHCFRNFAELALKMASSQWLHNNERLTTKHVVKCRKKERDKESTQLFKIFAVKTLCCIIEFKSSWRRRRSHVLGGVSQSWVGLVVAGCEWQAASHMSRITRATCVTQPETQPSPSNTTHSSHDFFFIFSNLQSVHNGLTAVFNLFAWLTYCLNGNVFFESHSGSQTKRMNGLRESINRSIN